MMIKMELPAGARTASMCTPAEVNKVGWFAANDSSVVIRADAIQLWSYRHT